MTSPTSTPSRAAGITVGASSRADGNDDVITRMPEAVARFYRGFFAGDVPAIVAELHPACRIRFPSYPVLHGVAAARDYFSHQDGSFGELAFELVDVFTTGPVTYVVWREDGLLADGTPWQAHGVDTLEQAHGLLRRVDVGGSAWPLREILPRYTPPDDARA